MAPNNELPSPYRRWAWLKSHQIGRPKKKSERSPRERGPRICWRYRYSRVTPPPFPPQLWPGTEQVDETETEKRLAFANQFDGRGVTKQKTPPSNPFLQQPAPMANRWQCNNTPKQTVDIRERLSAVELLNYEQQQQQQQQQQLRSKRMGRRPSGAVTSAKIRTGRP